MPLSPALLQSVLVEPDAPAPRPRLADELAQLEGDSPRVELIRIQIALEGTADDDRSWLELVKRERELLQAYQSVWERPLRNAIRPSIRSPGSWLRSHLFGTGGTWGFRRGFVEQVLASAAGFLAEDIQLFERTPLRNVLLTNATSAISELANEPHLDRLKSLHLVSDAEFDEDMALLVDSARQCGLEAFEVLLPRIDADIGELLSQLKWPTEEGEANPEEFRLWLKADENARARLRALASTPRFMHHLGEPKATTEIELLDAAAWVWFGDAWEEAGIWAVVKTFHDLEDENGFCRHVALGKPGRFKPEKLGF